MQLDPGDDEAEQAARKAVEARAREDIRRALAAQQQEIRDRIAVRTFQDFTEADFEPSEAELLNALRLALAQSADLGVQIAIRQFENVGLAFDWTLANAEAREWANSHAGELIGQIGETTRRRVQASVAAWIDSGAPLQSLIDDLAPVFGAQRAELIAATEVTSAYSRALIQSFETSGVVEKVAIRGAADDRVCIICRPIIEGGPYPLKTGHPDRGFPAYHPACRCWPAAVIE